MIETTQHGETVYYQSEQRGVEYTLRLINGEWEVHARRNALGRGNVGSYKWFDTLEQIEEKYKCFRGLSLLIR